MKKYRLTGITAYAKDHLCSVDLENLISMIGCNVYESKWKSMIDNRMMLDMPNGEPTHYQFLEMELLRQEASDEE